jgi:diguanylate cyclase (GGDEF)-like protein
MANPMTRKIYQFIKKDTAADSCRKRNAPVGERRTGRNIMSLLYHYEESNKELMRKNEQIDKLKHLIEINTYITNSLEKEEILKRILQQSKNLLNCESTSMLLVDRDINALRFAILSRDEEGELLKGTRLRKGEGIAGTVWSNGTAMIINDTHNDPRFSDVADKKARTETRSLIAVPLTVNGEIIGVIEAMNKISGLFTELDLTIMQYISTQSAIAIKNADLYDMAIRDGMTRLYINKYFKERLVEELKRARRYEHPISLAIMDIDYFKVFNDTYGHQAGDLVLKEVAQNIINCSRSIDIPCRYGGEEFAIILPETDREQAILFIERLRREIEEMRVEYGTSLLRVTVSAGVISFPDHNPNDAFEFLAMADKALYQSKKNGRNRTTFFTGTDPGDPIVPGREAKISD